MLAPAGATRVFIAPSSHCRYSAHTQGAMAICSVGSQDSYLGVLVVLVHQGYDSPTRAIANAQKLACPRGPKSQFMLTSDTHKECFAQS